MIILYLIGAYLLVGFVFAILFLLRWIQIVDEATHESPWTFKLTILPGCILFWPALLKRYLSKINTGHD